MLNLTKIIAFTEKTLKLDMRFKYQFFLQLTVGPVLTLASFLVLYTGFFTITSKSLGSLDSQNYIPALFLGSMALVFSNAGFNAFAVRLRAEKFWGTIQLMLLAPVNKFALLLGIVLADIIRSCISIIPMLMACYILFPTNLINILYVYMIFILISIGTSGIGLIIGAFAISNENMIPLFNYLSQAIIFFSTFFLPIEIFPDFLKVIIRMNPLYHGITLVRALWFNTGMTQPVTIPILWVLGAAVISPIIGVYFFNRIWQKIGIVGY